VTKLAWLKMTVSLDLQVVVMVCSLSVILSFSFCSQGRVHRSRCGPQSRRIRRGLQGRLAARATLAGRAAPAAIAENGCRWARSTLRAKRWRTRQDEENGKAGTRVKAAGLQGRQERRKHQQSTTYVVATAAVIAHKGQPVEAGTATEEARHPGRIVPSGKAWYGWL
jgi:hypothetical protein